MSAVKVTLKYYRELNAINVDVDRIDCGQIHPGRVPILATYELKTLLDKIFEVMVIENVQIVVK